MKSVSIPSLVRTLLLALLFALAAVNAPAQAPGDSPAPNPADLQSGFDAPLPGSTAGSAPGGPGAGAGTGTGEGGSPAPGAVPEGGFSDAFQLPAGALAEEAGPEEAAPSRWSLNGFLRLDGAYNYAHEAPAPGQTDWRGLSKLRTTAQLELTWEPAQRWKVFVSGQANRDFAYQLHGEEHYTPQVLDAYQQETELREAYVLGTPLPSLDIKVGRQIVVWGKSDNIRVVDVLNPVDLREPGLTDLEDLRLPVAMSKVSYYVGAWGLSAIAVHEMRFSKLPVPGSDYFPPGTPFPPDEVPANGGRNTEWGASLSGIFSGWDLAFYWANFYNDDFYVADADNDASNGKQAVRRHARLHMGGVAGNVALGNWLLKSELARFTGLRFANLPRHSFTRIDGLVGVEYAGITDTTLAFEASDRHLLDHEPLLLQPPDQQLRDVNQYVLSYRGSYLREKLDVVGVLSAFGTRGEEGTLQRYQLTYELAAALDGTLGVLIYTAGKGGNFLLVNAKDNDRAFFELKWSF
jgi:hypothetical protein